MSLKSRVQRQSCVYWAPASTQSGGRAFDNYGKPLYVTPVEKLCRWEDTIQIFVNTKGIEETSKSIVMVDAVEVGGLLLLGTLSDVTDLVNPRNNPGAWEIRQKENIPNFSGNLMYEWAYL